MSTEEKTSNVESFSARDYDRTLASIRASGSKIAKELTALEEDADRLASGNHPAPADVVRQSVTSIHVALEHLRSVFRVEF